MYKMPPKKRMEGETETEASCVSPTISVSEEMLHSLIANIVKSQAEINKQLIEELLSSNKHTTPAPDTCAQNGGNLARCTARFEGSSNTDELEAFIDAVEVYKDCTNTSDEHALRGLSMLLVGDAAVWWQGVKNSVTTWSEAVRRIRGMYGVPQPAYKIFRDVFATEQNSERADVFVNKVRALLSKLPYVTPEVMKLDIVYGLLNSRIRERVSRDTVHTLEQLIEKVRLVEESLAEVSSSCPSFPGSTDNDSTKCSDSKCHSESSQSSVTKYDNSSVARRRPKCIYCKIFGHSVEQCNRLKKNDKCNDNIKNNKTQLRCYGCGQLGVVRSRCDKCKDTDSNKKPDFLSAIFGELDINDVRPTVGIEILGRRGVAILDTGATHSIAGQSLYQILANAGVSFNNTLRTIGLADGTQTTRQTLECSVSVLIKGRKVYTDFIILPNSPTRTLLGRNFIVNAGLLLNMSQASWTFTTGPRQWYPFEGTCKSHNDRAMDVMELETTKSLLLRNTEGTKLTPSQRTQLNAFLVERADRFAKKGPPTDYALHRIKIDPRQEPIASPPYRMSQGKKELLEQQLQKLLETDVIEECESPWAVNVVLVTKKDGGVRLCVDYRKLNAVIEPDRYPLPRIEDLLHAAKNTNYITTCDFRSGYFQLAIDPDDRDKPRLSLAREPFGLRECQWDYVIPERPSKD